jgi:hypothetical protein
MCGETSCSALYQQSEYIMYALTTSLLVLSGNNSLAVFDPKNNNNWSNTENWVGQTIPTTPTAIIYWETLFLLTLMIREIARKII